MSLLGNRIVKEHTLEDDVDIATNCGFIPDADGSFEGRLFEDSAATTFNVKGGAFYPGDILEARLTSASGVTKIQVWGCKPTP